jgi:hypothetical protein
MAQEHGVHSADPKWEYTLYTLNGSKDQEVALDFNRLGLEGWELVAFLPWLGNPGGRAVFKRKC